MANAIIYQPAKTAMQSGKGKIKHWLLEYKRNSKHVVDNLMGWQGGTDMNQEVKLKFDNKESAIEYAQKHDIEFEIKEPKAKKLKIQQYADNFQ